MKSFLEAVTFFATPHPSFFLIFQTMHYAAIHEN